MNLINIPSHFAVKTSYKPSPHFRLDVVYKMGGVLTGHYGNTLLRVKKCAALNGRRRGLEFRLECSTGYMHVPRVAEKGNVSRFAFRVSHFAFRVSRFAFRVSHFAFRVSRFVFNGWNLCGLGFLLTSLSVQ